MFDAPVRTSEDVRRNWLRRSPAKVVLVGVALVLSYYLAPLVPDYPCDVCGVVALEDLPCSDQSLPLCAALVVASLLRTPLVTFAWYSWALDVDELVLLMLPEWMTNCSQGGVIRSRREFALAVGRILMDLEVQKVALNDAEGRRLCSTTTAPPHLLYLQNH